MPILKAIAAVGEEVLTIDVLEHEGAFWLVPEWLEANDGSHRMPVRMISLATSPHDVFPEGSPAHFVVNTPLPKSLMKGRVPEQEAAQHEIRDYPDIKVPSPKRGGQ